MYAAGIPTLLGNIVRGGTVYFLVVFAGQLFFMFFQLLAPVSDLSADSFSSTHLITATHSRQSKRYQRGKSPPSNISIKVKPDYVSLTNSLNIV